MTEKLKICQGDFYYFNYFLKAKDNKIIEENSFYNEENMPKIFNFYEQTENAEICLIKELQNAFKCSSFFCYLSYYMIFSKEAKVCYVCDSKSTKSLVEKIIQLTFALRDITKINATYSEVKKSIVFSNGGRIDFYTDITYNFMNISKKSDLLIFDNAAMKNFDKLLYTVESVINGNITNKMIINFNYMPPIFYGTENFNYLITEFKNYIKLITTEK